MLTLYDKLPELSVEPCHDRLTLVVVIFVTTRFAGAVGADLSPFPTAAELAGPLKSSAVVNAKIVIPMIRRESCRVVMSLLLLTNFLFRQASQSSGASSALSEHTGPAPTLDENYFKRTREREREIIRSFKS
jgi:hypothetical protein